MADTTLSFDEDIVGIIVLETKKLHGHTKKGLPIYSFIPLSNKYPRFFVPSSHKERRNILAVIRFNRWEGVNPVGTCIRILGPADDLLMYDYALLLKNNLHTSIQQIKCEEPALDLNLTDSSVNYHNITVIDPEGSTDRDDGFHISKESSLSLLYVHIADVDYYFPANGSMDERLKNRITSIYSLSKVYHMLPEQYACDIISLHEGSKKRRRVLTTVFEITDKGPVFREVHPATVTIAAHTSFTYEQAQSAMADNQQIQWLSEITGQTDTHKMVEKIMIWTNSAIAEYIYRHGYNFSVYYPPQDTNSRPVRSVYSTEKHGHGMMGLEHYTHFTSPIRRYADIIVHRIVKAILTSKPLDFNLTEYAEQINKVTQRAKDYYRNQDFLKLIDKLPKDGTPVISTCTVMEITEPNYISVYLKDYNIVLHTTLFARELIGISPLSSPLTSLSSLSSLSFSIIFSFNKLECNI